MSFSDRDRARALMPPHAYEIITPGLGIDATALIGLSARRLHLACPAMVHREACRCLAARTTRNKGLLARFPERWRRGDASIDICGRRLAAARRGALECCALGRLGAIRLRATHAHLRQRELGPPPMGPRQSLTNIVKA